VTIMRDGEIIDTKAKDDLTRAEMIAKMVGRSIENEYPERPNNVGSTLMEVRSINTRKLHDVSFKLNKGEILGLVGLVGAGRPEIVRALFGADKTEGHQILIDGAPSASRIRTMRRKPVSASCRKTASCRASSCRSRSRPTSRWPASRSSRASAS